jgi:hypothetical protein
MADYSYRDFADENQDQQFPVLYPAFRLHGKFPLLLHETNCQEDNKMQSSIDIFMQTTKVYSCPTVINAFTDRYDAPAMMHHNNNPTNAQNAAGAHGQQGITNFRMNSQMLMAAEYPQNQVIGEMVQFSSNLSNMVQDLNERLTKVEYENQELRYMITQQGPMTPQHCSMTTQHPDAINAPHSAPIGRNLSWYHYDANGSPTPARRQGSNLRPASSSARKNKVEKTKARKQLQIKIPGKAVFAPPLTVGLPTPLTRTQVCISTVPFTS